MDLNQRESLRYLSNNEISDKEDTFSEESKGLSTFRQNRIFINQMDSYHGKTLAKFLLRDSKEQCEGVKLPEVNPSTEDRDLYYDVIGSLADTKNDFNYHKARIINSNNKEIFLNELLYCGFVIYDVTLDDEQISEAEWALQALMHHLEANNDDDDEIHHFLLISTAMTWSSTRQLDPLNQNAPVNELDYKKRIGHPNFIKHKDLETQVTRINDNLKLNNLKALVLCCGITYGNGEDPLHFLFKLAWQNSPFLPIFNSGNNRIPLLHVDDLARIIEALLHNWPEDRCYIVAAELNVSSQMTIVESISRSLTTGRVQHTEFLENSSFRENISTRDFDFMMLDVNLEPAFTVDHNIQSHRDFHRDIKATVNEYRLMRNLQPVRIILLGPPVTGKTTLALRLAHYYRIPYVSVESLITETIQELTNAIEKEVGGILEESIKDNGNEKDEEQRAVVETTKDLNSTPQNELEKQLDEIFNNLSVNNGRLSDDILNKFMRKKLMSSECNNQGYILDDYPNTPLDAVKLFIDNVTSELIEPEDTKKISLIIPETVIQLQATDEFLQNCVLNLPERVMHDAHYDVDGMLEYLRKYREKNHETLEFFIGNGIHPLIVTIEDESIGMDLCFQRCLETIGEPRNYGPTGAVRDAEEPVIVSSENELDFQGIETREDVEWRNEVETTERQEEESLREQLRLYLVKYVFSTLNQGLIQVVQSRPKDPIDSLADYLFKNNPEGKMDEICVSWLQGMDQESSSEEFYDEGSSNNEY